MQAYLGDDAPQIYTATVARHQRRRGSSCCRRERLRRRDPRVVPDGHAPARGPVPRHAQLASRSSASASGCSRSGSLSAGLTHELNNPAAAAVRATAALRERVAGMRHKLAMLAARRDRPAAAASCWSTSRRRPSSGSPSAPELTADGGVASARTSSTDWLDEHGVAGGWELAPIFVAAGLDADVARPGRRARRRRTSSTARIRWLAYTLETELLMDEIDDSVDPHLHAGRRGQAVLADGPRARSSASTCTSGSKSTLVDAGRQARPASRSSRSTTGRCRRSPPTPASSTRCGPT